MRDRLFAYTLKKPIARLRSPRLMNAPYAVWVIAGTLLAAASPVTQTRTPITDAQIASTDRFVAAEMVRSHVPGAAVGIYSRGEILLAKGYGLANMELGVPVRPETIFQSGSVGKQFVSAAIMMLVEEGRVSLNDSIAKYFPNAPASWNMAARGKGSPVKSHATRTIR